MKTYVAQWKYSSSLGQLAEGQEIELTDEQAQAYNNDSPGVLKVKAKKRTTRKKKAAAK